VTNRFIQLLFLALVWLASATTISAQQNTADGLDPDRATKLAEMMCRQLPNVQSMFETAKRETPDEVERETHDTDVAPPLEDDVHDTLLRLGQYSLPCLVDELTDVRWMPDPRQEAMMGPPLVGDVAYLILLDLGVPDILPTLGDQPPDMPGMLFYTWWPSVGKNRLKLQVAVRAWVQSHPDCCAPQHTSGQAGLPQPKFRMTEADLMEARARFSRLHPGMSREEVLKVAGKPDAMDPSKDKPSDSSPEGSEGNNLLGYCAMNHNEQLAYIYFTERWTDGVARRDPPRDRYVILLFSGKNKFTRMFSNIAEIPPVFPHSERAWMKLMWGN
jgi:hypothetical protein